jgi:antitoxin (DNA-binding transcriptional repressor) of toxin-antitoxin stability system
MPIIPAYPTMGIREFKANLSAVLKRVQKGERITLTNHGELIVDLCPPAEKPIEELTWEEAKAKLDKLYGPRKKFDVMKLTPADIPFTGPSLSDILLEDRGERF